VQKIKVVLYKDGKLTFYGKKGKQKELQLQTKSKSWVWE